MTALISEQLPLLASAFHGTALLRKAILGLAIRGLLVSQDEADEPAGALEERAAALKPSKLTKLSSAPAPVIDAPYELPRGWLWTTLPALAVINPRNQAEDDSEASFVPMAAIGTGFSDSHTQETRRWGDIKTGFTHFAEGDIGVAKITPCFENSKACVFSGLINGIGAGTTELHVVRPLGGTLAPRYVLAYLKSPWFLDNGESKMTGTAGQKRLPKDFVERHPFPLPPLAEQHRIVAKVDELMALCDRLEARQQDAEAAHARLVQALLDSLTQARDADDFQARWQRLTSAFAQAFITESSVDALTQTIRALAFRGALSSSGAADWRHVRISDVVQFLNGYAFKSEWFVPHGIRLVRNVNIAHGSIDWREAACIPTERSEEFAAFALKEGDVLLTLDRPIISTGLKVAVVRLVDLPCLLLQRVARLTPRAELLRATFLLHWLHSPLFMDAIDPGRSNGVPHISTKQVGSMAIPLPPLDEQDRIVAKMERLLALCDQLKARIATARAKHAQLAEALVAQAVAA